MLSRVSSDLRAFLGSDGVVGRFGGDEFLIVYLKSTAYEDVHAFFMRMYQSGGVLRKTIELDDLSLFVTGTLGSAFYSGDAVEFDDLFARIDKALYRGKSKGRNCFIMYVAAKHDQLRIPTLSKRSLYETFRAMAEGFDSADEVRLKLFHAFQPLRDNLHLNRLLCLSRDGRLTDAENGMLIEMTGCMDDSMPQGVYAVSDLNDMKRRCHALYGALTGLGLGFAGHGNGRGLCLSAPVSRGAYQTHLAGRRIRDGVHPVPYAVTISGTSTQYRSRQMIDLPAPAVSDDIHQDSAKMSFAEM